MATAKFKELMKKYGKVGLIVHCSISAVSISGLYIAIKNNVDVESMIEKVGLPSLAKDKKDSKTAEQNPELIGADPTMKNDHSLNEKNRTAELAASSGGALALAVLINKALFPVRVPITLAVTPPLARFLARRNIFSKSV
ncbi:hypothetical protein ACS0TY_001596 [Phlomoides rotata]